MKPLPLATWGNRFWAWLIDILLVSLIWDLVAGLFIYVGDVGSYRFLGPFSHSLLLFVYWTLLEGYRGQSIGKMALNIAVVETEGDILSFKGAAVESFGKAFLLPFDCLAGWLAMPGSGQRLFNRASRTVVVKTTERGGRFAR
ncbi:MAG: RDD family protein [Methanosarcinales archaeon]|nr:RDD family protein [Methanosarcinales archaeon]